MGVPSFFAWLTRKYPSVLVNAVEDRRVEINGVVVPVDCTQPNPNFQEFDNLYLDMNGIIHPCTHPENRPAPTTEEEMFVLIFEYIDRMFSIVRPRRLLYMAIDGVAPRAKMNQQRSRRFRASKEAVEKEMDIESVRQRLEEEGLPLPPKKAPEERFDSNCITPGTPFMDRLAVALHYYIYNRLTNDPAWARIQVILSDANVPGEGEHKIMDFIRRQRSSPSHDPNTVHCLCGADADLIMLGLATHEANFNIIREEFVRNQQRPCELCGQYGHELKQCQGLANEDTGPETATPFEKTTNFIFLRIPVLREYLERDLVMHNLPFPYDFERVVDDWVLLCFFVGNDFLPHLPSLEIREGAIDRLVRIYLDNIHQMDGYLTCNGEVNMRRAEVILSALGRVEDEIFKRRQENELRYRANQAKRGRGSFGNTQRPAYTPGGNSLIAPRHSAPANMSGADTRAAAREDRVKAMNFAQNKEAADRLNAFLKMSSSSSADAKSSTDNPAARIAPAAENPRKRKATEPIELPEPDEPMDEVRLWEEGWKDRYYRLKFDVEPDDIPFRRRVAWAYAEGLAWVFRYYYQGCASWDWYFPYHYAPFASDFDTIHDFTPDFSKPTKPFKPLEQLMSVFPAASKQHLPLPWQKLMTDADSPIIDFYPLDFKIDLNGKKFAWQGVALLPFVDEKRLVKTLTKVYDQLTPDEIRRNSIGSDRVFVGIKHPAFAFFHELYNTTNEDKPEMVDLPPKFSYGMAGRVCADKGAVLPNRPYASPITGQDSCPDLPKNEGIMAVFEDPQFPRGFVFPPHRLPNVKDVAKTLKPGDWDDRKNGQYRPQIGFSRDVQRAELTDASHRHLGHELHIRSEHRGQGDNYYSTGFGNGGQAYGYYARDARPPYNAGGGYGGHQGGYSRGGGGYSGGQRDQGYGRNERPYDRRNDGYGRGAGGNYRGGNQYGGGGNWQRY